MEKNSKLINRLYEKLYLIRRTEEEVVNVYPTDKIKSPIHLSIGQESVSVGICDNLEKNDVVFGTYRGHAMYLAKGGDLNKLIAELYGKETGCCKGRGGSMHIIDKKVGVMGTSAIVGTTIPIAVGYAQALKLQGSDSIVVVFFGDGAMDEGVVHESINYASLKGLPILFVCENNLYAIYDYVGDRHSFGIEQLSMAYNIRNSTIFHDIFYVKKESNELIKHVRKNKRPAFLNIETARFKEHVGPNKETSFRSDADKSLIKKTLKDDEVKNLRSIVKNPEEIEMKVDKKIKEAFEFAEESAEPNPNELWRFNYE